jgi:FtsP/CotA-like multicopper oxidase with cupredoxin domain
MLTRRQFMHATAAATAACAAVPVCSGEDKQRTAAPTPPLTPFKDRLPLPPVLRPQPSQTGLSTLRVRMCPARVALHSELPPSDVWTYEGVLPGPTIEVQRAQKVLVEWVNQIPQGQAYPVLAVKAPAGTQERAGREGRAADALVAALPPWTVVHLHGGRTGASSDGWTENALLPGQATASLYTNDQRATMLWYHDHALGITRYNICVGLAGLWLIRDEEERALRLPAGPYEVPLVIQDRNLDTNSDGSLSGRLLHKITDDTMEFFAPFTTVNGTIWPYLRVEARQYRLRVLNACNSRTYRLVLLDEEGSPVSDKMSQIGTDGGLLAAPVPVPPEGLLLGSAERADLIVDFRAFRGRRLILVNTASAPFKGEPAGQPPGKPNPKALLPYPQVMEFRVADARVDDSFVLSGRLSSLKSLAASAVKPTLTQRLVALVKHTMHGQDTFLLHELQPVLGPAHAEPLICVKDERGAVTQYRTVAKWFEDGASFFVPQGATEVWHFLNLTKSAHPMHVHLVHFQVLRRGIYTAETSPTGKLSATFRQHRELEANHLGLKDTVLVNPGEMVSIVATFDSYTGRYMYHCHMLEHEDMDMMRPFVVVPAGALAAMRMDA